MTTYAFLILVWFLSGYLSSLTLKDESIFARVLFGFVCGYALVALVLETILFWG